MQQPKENKKAAVVEVDEVISHEHSHSSGDRTIEDLREQVEFRDGQTYEEPSVMIAPGVKKSKRKREAGPS